MIEAINNPLNSWSKREKFESPDEVYTPEEAIYPLLEFIKYLNIDKDNMVIWDCAYGSGRLAENFEKFGYCIFGNGNADFLKESLENVNLKETESIDAIITNPPYSIKDKFLERAFKIGIPFAFLLPTKAIGEQKRVSMFKEHGIQMIIPNERINFEIPSKKKTPWFHASWFVYGWNLPNDLNFVNMKELRDKYAKNSKSECGKKFNEKIFSKDSLEYKTGMISENENCLPNHKCPECVLNAKDGMEEKQC